MGYCKETYCKLLDHIACIWLHNYMMWFCAQSDYFGILYILVLRCKPSKAYCIITPCPWYTGGWCSDCCKTINGSQQLSKTSNHWTNCQIQSTWLYIFIQCLLYRHSSRVHLHQTADRPYHPSLYDNVWLFWQPVICLKMKKNKKNKKFKINLKKLF